MSDQYALAVARQAVARLADASGFDALQKSSHDILSDLLMRYMEEVGRLSHENTELAGRTEPNAMDVCLALNDLGVSIQELDTFRKTQGGSGPCQSVGRFPLEKRAKPTPTFAQRGEAPPAHIPNFLPAFPDRHTYCETPEIPQPNPDPVAKHLAHVEDRQEGERALVKLHARAAPDDAVLASALPPPPVEAAGSASDPWAGPVLVDQLPFAPPPGQRAGIGEPAAGDAGEMVTDGPGTALTEDARAGLAAVTAPMFQPWDWQAQLEGLAASFRDPLPEEDEFAVAAHGPAGLSTKHGRQSKRSARALDAGHSLSDPTRQRVEAIIEASREAESAAAVGVTGDELMYGDDDDAENL